MFYPKLIIEQISLILSDLRKEKDITAKNIIGYGVGNFPGDFLKHGSSSGIDMLCGMLCGLNILRKGES